MSSSREHILVIRLGALGDLVFCQQAFAEIRLAHPDAEIALLTRAPFAEFAMAMPWFDRVIIDTHPKATQPGDWARLRRTILDFAPDRVYDLQGKFRQSVLYTLIGGPVGPDWSGAAFLCKYPRVWPLRPGMHFTDFLAAQLREAGVREAPKPDLRWLDAQVGKFDLPARYAVLIPGCSPAAPYKRWPAQKYAELAERLGDKGIPCVVVGTGSDAEAVSAIATHANDIVDLCGQTSILELAGILRRSVGAVGNDTGPTHLSGALDVPTVALFSGQSDPVWSKPPGERVLLKQSLVLSDLSVNAVNAAFESLLQHAEGKGR